MMQRVSVRGRFGLGSLFSPGWLSEGYGNSQSMSFQASALGWKDLEFFSSESLASRKPSIPSQVWASTTGAYGTGEFSSSYGGSHCPWLLLPLPTLSRFQRLVRNL